MNMIYDDNSYRFVGVVGDLHQQWFIVTDYLNEHNLTNAALICVGDFGIGLGFSAEKSALNDKLVELNDSLQECNSILYTIRGNHDNPKYFDGKHDLSNVKFLPDYSVLHIDGRSIFCLGGGISIDRKQNIDGIDWFEDEVVNFDFDKINETNNIEVMIAHIAPEGVYPFHFNHLVENYAQHDNNLKSDLSFERLQMRQFVDRLKEKNPYFTQYYYGHYHQNQICYIGDMKYIMVGVQTIVPLR